MGGFHATLCPDEVAGYAEAVVVGEAEDVWPRGDRRRCATAGCKPLYRVATAARPRRGALRPLGSSAGKRYLPIGLVEAGRGCRFRCDFCAVQTVFERTARPADRRRSSPRSQRSKDGEAPVLLRRRQLRRRPRVARELCRGAGAARASAGSPRRASTPRTTRSSSAALARERLPRRADRLREPRRERCAPMNKTLQHHARRLYAGARQSAPARHPRLRHLRLRLRRRHGASPSTRRWTSPSTTASTSPPSTT